jgi:hypothetical protein
VAFFILITALTVHLLGLCLPQHWSIIAISALICLGLATHYTVIATAVSTAKQKNTAILEYQIDHRTHAKNGFLFFVEVPYQEYWWSPRPQTQNTPVLDYYKIEQIMPGIFVPKDIVQKTGNDIPYMYRWARKVVK